MKISKGCKLRLSEKKLILTDVKANKEVWFNKLSDYFKEHQIFIMMSVMEYIDWDFSIHFSDWNKIWKIWYSEHTHILGNSKIKIRIIHFINFIIIRLKNKVLPISTRRNGRQHLDMSIVITKKFPFICNVTMIINKTWLRSISRVNY